MINFFELWKKALNVRPHLLLEIGYNRVAEYNIYVEDATGVGISNAKRIFHFQGITTEEVFARATVALIDFLNEECGGY